MCTVENCKLLKEVSGVCVGGGHEQSHMNMGWKPWVFVRKDNIEPSHSINQPINLCAGGPSIKGSD